MEAKSLLLTSSNPKKSTNKRIKLLEKITTTTTSSKNVSASQQATLQQQHELQQKAAAEDLQSIILDRMGDLQSDKRLMQMIAKEQQIKDKDVEPQHVNLSAAEIIAKIEEIAGNEVMAEKEKVDELYKYYVEQAFEELKNVHK